MPSSDCPICDVVVEVDSAGMCPRCGNIIAAVPAHREVSNSLRMPSKPEGAGRRESTSSQFDLRGKLDFPEQIAEEKTPPPESVDRTSRPNWARPRKTRESSVVAAPSGPPAAIVWGAGALLALLVGFALSYFLA